MPPTGSVSAISGSKRTPVRSPSWSRRWRVIHGPRLRGWDWVPALLRVDRTADAIEKLRHATVLEPGMFDAYPSLDRAYRAAGDTTRAREGLR